LGSQAASTASKRGARYNLGLMLFLLLLTLPLMGFGLYIFFTAASSYIQVNGYAEGRCTILSKKLLADSVSDDSSPTNTGFTTIYRPDLTYNVQTADGKSYKANGYDVTRNYSSDESVEQAILDSYRVGRVYPCWYNPAQPSQAVLNRDVAPGSFIFGVAFFGAGVLFFILILLYIRLTIRQGREMSTTEAEYAIEEGV
jgi:hypothetical protein